MCLRLQPVAPASFKVKPRQVASAKCRSRAVPRPFVATSQFWWEEEQEYDGITEVLHPKNAYLVAADVENTGDLRRRLAPTKFSAAFGSKKRIDTATRLWEELGQAGPPLFLKVRSREALNILEDGKSSSEDTAKAAAVLLDELCKQNWRLELDYGLDSAAAAPVEYLLVITNRLACQRLLAAAVPSTVVQMEGGRIASLNFKGWTTAASSDRFESWRQLTPELGMVL